MCRIPRRHEYRRSGVGGNGDLQRQSTVLTLPVADDPAVGRVVITFHPSQVANHGGLDDDLLKAGCRRIWTNTGQALIEPAVQGSETRMDLRIVTVPLFPPSGGTLLEHVSPARIVPLGNHQPHEVVEVAVEERLVETEAREALEQGVATARRKRGRPTGRTPRRCSRRAPP